MVQAWAVPEQAEHHSLCQRATCGIADHLTVSGIDFHHLKHLTDDLVDVAAVVAGVSGHFMMPTSRVSLALPRIVRLRGSIPCDRQTQAVPHDAEHCPDWTTDPEHKDGDAIAEMPEKAAGQHAGPRKEDSGDQRHSRTAQNLHTSQPRMHINQQQTAHERRYGTHDTDGR